MRITRIFHSLIGDSQILWLSKPASHHLLTVLRQPIGGQCELFDGTGSHYLATILAIEKKQVQVQIVNKIASQTCSPLQIHLGQVISRGERMDFTIQKAVELGVASITPLFSERCTVKLQDDRLEKKMAHWQAIVISACEQCGQDTLPHLFPAVHLAKWLPTVSGAARFILDPTAAECFRDVQSPLTKVTLLVGAEGGLTEQEIQLTQQAGFTGLQLGPRILRTETAALTALSILQYRFGDL